MLKFINYVMNTVILDCMLLCVLLWALVGVVKAANILNNIKLTVLAQLLLASLILIPIIAYFIK